MRKLLLLSAIPILLIGLFLLFVTQSNKSKDSDLLIWVPQNSVLLIESNQLNQVAAFIRDLPLPTPIKESHWQSAALRELGELQVQFSEDSLSNHACILWAKESDRLSHLFIIKLDSETGIGKSAVKAWLADGESRSNGNHKVHELRSKTGKKWHAILKGSTLILSKSATLLDRASDEKGDNPLDHFRNLEKVEENQRLFINSGMVWEEFITAQALQNDAYFKRSLNFTSWLQFHFREGSEGWTCTGLGPKPKNSPLKRFGQDPQPLSAQAAISMNEYIGEEGLAKLAQLPDSLLEIHFQPWFSGLLTVHAFSPLNPGTFSANVITLGSTDDFKMKKSMELHFEDVIQGERWPFSGNLFELLTPSFFKGIDEGVMGLEHPSQLQYGSSGNFLNRVGIPDSASETKDLLWQGQMEASKLQALIAAQLGEKTTLLEKVLSLLEGSFHIEITESEGGQNLIIQSSAANRGKSQSSALWTKKISESGLRFIQSFPENMLLCQDRDNNLMALNKGGQLLWQLELPQAILGEVRQVDDGGKKIFVFASQNFIFQLDQQGQAVNNFPIECKIPNRGGISIVEYDGGKQRRMFLACGDKGVYAYELSGKPLIGWSPKQGLGEILQGPTHVFNAGKDYLIFQNAQNKIHILNRKGERRFPVVDPGKVFNQAFVEDPHKRGTLYNLANDGTAYRIDLANAKVGKRKLSVDAQQSWHIALSNQQPAMHVWSGKQYLNLNSNYNQVSELVVSDAISSVDLGLIGNQTACLIQGSNEAELFLNGKSLLKSTTLGKAEFARYDEQNLNLLYIADELGNLHCYELLP